MLAFVYYATRYFYWAARCSRLHYYYLLKTSVLKIFLIFSEIINNYID